MLKNTNETTTEVPSRPIPMNTPIGVIIEKMKTNINPPFFPYLTFLAYEAP